ELARGRGSRPLRGAGRRARRARAGRPRSGRRGGSAGLLSSPGGRDDAADADHGAELLEAEDGPDALALGGSEGPETAPDLEGAAAAFTARLLDPPHLELDS